MEGIVERFPKVGLIATTCVLVHLVGEVSTSTTPRLFCPSFLLELGCLFAGDCLFGSGRSEAVSFSRKA